MSGGFCALRALRLILLRCLGRLRGEARVCAAGPLKKTMQGLSFEPWLLYPAGTEAFIFFNLGRLRGGRQMGAC